MLSASGIDERHEAKDLHGCWTALERPPSQVGDVRLNEPVELVHELHRVLVGRPSRAASHRWALFPFALQKKAKKQDMSQLRLDVELTKRQTGKYLKHRRAVASSVVCP